MKTRVESEGNELHDGKHARKSPINPETAPSTSAETIPFLGRRLETARLIEAIRERRSLLIFGPPDSGKSALVGHALSRLPAGIVGHTLQLSASGTFQDLLRQHAMQLCAAGDPVVQAAYRRQATSFRSVEAWVRKQSSARLRGLLFRAFDRNRYWIFWDDVCRTGLAHFHFLRETIQIRKTPVYLLARGLGAEEAGEAGRLFWSDEQRLKLGPLSPAQGRALLASAVEGEGLAGLDLAEFREQVLECSRNLPGAIVKMVALAGQPQYRWGKRVKAKLTYMDYLVQLAARVQVRTR